MHQALRAGAVVLGLLLPGCALTGPTSLRVSRGDYNEAIRRTNGEQLLLNLVRLRYRDTPCWLEVASVTTSYDFTASAGGSADFPLNCAASPGTPRSSPSAAPWAAPPTATPSASCPAPCRGRCSSSARASRSPRPTRRRGG